MGACPQAAWSKADKKGSHNDEVTQLYIDTGQSNNEGITAVTAPKCLNYPPMSPPCDAAQRNEKSICFPHLSLKPTRHDIHDSCLMSPRNTVGYHKNKILERIFGFQ